MGSFNSITLQGRLTKPPVLSTAGQNNVVNVGLAVNSRRKNQNGDFETDFFDLAIWGKQAENTAQYCVQGQEVIVQGSVSLRTYTKNDGTLGASIKVDVREISFGAKPREDGQPQNGGHNHQAPQQQGPPPQQQRQAPASQQQAYQPQYQPQYQQQAPQQGYHQQQPYQQPYNPQGAPQQQQQRPAPQSAAYGSNFDDDIPF